MSEPIIENESSKVIPVDLVREMKKSYIDYSMSVIVGRALPDVRDGLKPVHRRILYTMYEAGFMPDKPHRKCATTVGDVLGKYHPHGDMSVYDALVRMAQSFSLRYPLVDGHGNFGSVDGDSAAAYRYTEARLAKLAAHMLTDIDKETVDYQLNYDDRLQEPVVLPSRFPNLLVNGSAGIAVGMATNIPPHNLTEVINGIVALIDDPEIDIDGLMQYIKGPDFPTAGLIMGKSGIRSAYHTGRGKVIMRARTEIEVQNNGKTRIIVTELPYQVNKARLIVHIAELVKDKRIEGISDINDYSDRDGMRIVVDIKRDANANVVLNNLFKHSQLQESFGIINLALHKGQPRVMNLKKMLVAYVNFQKDVITRRAIYDKKKAEARAHILEGYRIALDHIDEVIRTIRESYDNAKPNLMEKFGFSEIQAQAILDMQLKRLQGLEREKIDDEYNKLMDLIAYLTALLENEQMVLDVLKKEIIEIRDKYGDERRSELIAVHDEIDDEDLIPETECVVTLTNLGYIKRTGVDAYKAQKRGGRGVTGLATREEDFVEHLFIGNSHDSLLIFTNLGRVYRMKAYEISEAGRNAKGTAIVNLLEMQSEEKITAMIAIPKTQTEGYLTMVTRNGIVKRSELSVYINARRSGVNGIVLDEGDSLIQVAPTDGKTDIILATNQGIGIRFDENEVRCAGRVSRGVRGIRLREGDYIVGMATSADSEQYLLCVTENGYGKRTEINEYRKQSRGGMGSKTYRISEETGKISAAKTVTDDNDIMLITSEGVIIRMESASIRNVGRVSKGVRLVRLGDGATVVGLGVLDKTEEEQTNAESNEPAEIITESTEEPTNEN